MTPLTLTIALASLGPLAAAPDGAPRLRIETLQAAPLEGRLTAIRTDGRLALLVDGRASEIPLEDLSSISPTAGTSPRRGDGPNRCTFYLADGGRLRGRLLAGAEDQPRLIRVEAGFDRPVEAPFDALAAVRFARPQVELAEAELQSRITRRPIDKDLLIIARDAKPVVLPGALERLSPQGWEFRIGERVQSAALDTAYAVVLAAAGPASVGPATVYLADGDSFTARLVSADATTVTTAGGLGRLSVPWSEVRTIVLRSERVAWLSDLQPIETRERSVLDLSWPVRRDRAAGGGPIALRGTTYAKGLGVHARTAVTYRLGGRFARFSALVGVDDAVGGGGSVVFRVRVDGRVAYESKLLTGRDEPLPVSVDLDGADLIVLECDDADGLDLGDHGDWANAMVLRARSGGVR